jgi:hypothetical protein
MRAFASLLVAVTLLTVPIAHADEQPLTWAVTLQPTDVFSGPTEESLDFGQIPISTTVEVLRYDGDWAYVMNPRTRETGFVPSELLGPSEQPSRYLLLAPPKLMDEFQTRGIVTDETSGTIYPTTAEEAIQADLKPNTWLQLEGMVQGEDGATWYLTRDGAYVPSQAVFVPERTEDFSGRWLDVDLTVPAHVTMYEGGENVGSFLTIKGAGNRPTPTGVFTIIRRVANETMNSDTIGIPRFGPGGYYLPNVLFTQYFTGDGASLHYNYWSSNWGYAGSHGCLGLTYGDSAHLWEWAHLGTPLIIHY